MKPFPVTHFNLCKKMESYLFCQTQPPTSDFSLACHEAAYAGDLETIKKIAAHDPRALHYADENGWQVRLCDSYNCVSFAVSSMSGAYLILFILKANT